MKRLLSLLGMLIVALSTFAQTFTVGDLTYQVTSTTDKAVRVSDGKNATGDVFVPETVTYNDVKYNVTAIGSNAFESNKDITSVSMPSVTSINSYAFQYCSALTSVSIPAVTSIGGYAFGYCTSLTSFDFSNVQKIGDYAYLNCSSIATDFDFRNLTELGTSALYGMDIKSVRISTIEQWCAALKNHTGDTPWGNSYQSDITLFTGDSTSPTESIVVPNTIKTIPSYAFAGFKIKHAEMSNVEVIERHAFDRCYELEYVDVSNVKTIESYAFFACRSLYSMRIGSIEQWCNVNFGDENSVPIYHITSWPDHDTKPRNIYIGDSCEPASELFIPASVTKIPAYAFFRTSAYMIHLGGTTPPVIGNINAFPDASVLCVPEEAYLDYLNADVYSTIPLRISVEGSTYADVELTAKDATSNLLEKIGEDNVGKIVKLKISGTINSYDMMIIRNKMTCLRYVDLSEAAIVHNDYCHYSGCNSNDNEVGAYMFAGLNIMYVKLPENVTKIGSGAFKECRSLISVNIPDGVTDIGAYAFKMCTNMSKVDIPSKLQSLGNMAFGGCAGIEDAIIPDGVTIIPKDCFLWCPNLQTIKIPSSITYIGSAAFEPGIPSEMWDGGGGTFGNTNKSTGNYDVYISDIDSWIKIGKSDSPKISVKNLYIGDSETPSTEIIIPEGLTSIPSNCFSGFKSIKKFIFPSTLREIGVSAFGGCGGIEDINISNVQLIAESAFSGCWNLSSVIWGDCLRSIGNYAFYGCNFQRLELSPYIETIGSYAFASNKNLEEVLIPSGIKTIGNYALSNCSNLNRVIATTIEPVSISQSTFSSYQSTVLYIPKSSYSKYYWNTQWSQFLSRKEYDKEFAKVFGYKYFYLNGQNGDNSEDFVISDETGPVQGVDDKAPDADFYEGAGLVVSGEQVQNLGDIHLHHNGNNGASIIAKGSGKVHIDNLYVDIKTQKNRWYFFCFPFDVNTEDATFDGSHVWYLYDGETRAQNGNGGWKKTAVDGVMKAGYGYIFQGAQNGTLTIHVSDLTIDTTDSKTNMITYASDNKNDASWNLIGNPSVAYYDMDNLEYDAPITLYNNETGNYEAVRPGDDQYEFYPFQAFFVQKPEGVDALNFEADKKETKNMADKKKPAASGAKAKGNSMRKVINLEMTAVDEANDSIAAPIDRTRIVVNPMKTTAYEPECDAAKFIADNIPQIYSVNADGSKYAINERPVEDGIIDLAVKADKEGIYTISATRLDCAAKLRDLEADTEVDLAEGGYTFMAEAKTYTNRFQLVLSNVVTAITTPEEAQAAINVEAGAINITNSNANVKVYSVGGSLVAAQKGAGTISVPAGTYVVNVNGQSIKINVNINK